jgi:hypothetical protein
MRWRLQNFPLPLLQPGGCVGWRVRSWLHHAEAFNRHRDAVRMPYITNTCTFNIGLPSYTGLIWIKRQSSGRLVLWAFRFHKRNFLTSWIIINFSTKTWAITLRPEDQNVHTTLQCLYSAYVKLFTLHLCSLIFTEYFISRWICSVYLRFK